MFRRAPASTAAAILTIALGIAANTAVFSAVNAAMLRPLPYPDASRLMQVAERNEKLNLPYFSASALNYLSWKELSRTFDQMGAFGGAAYTITGRGEPEQVIGCPVSPSLVPLLGLQPIAGRTFREDEDRPGASPVVMISDALWRRRFAGDPSVVGTPVTLNGVVHTLVGVMGPELHLLTGGELFVPMVIDQTRENRLSHVISVVGRLRPDITVPMAQAEMDAIGRRVVEQYPEVRDWTVRLRSLSDWLVGDQLRTGLLVLMGAVLLLLVLVCVNVANLLLSQAVARQRELAIRGALGASGGRLARQLFTEGILLSLAGGTAGLMLAAGAISLFNTQLTGQRLVTGVRLDGAVLLFTLTASVVTGLLFCAAPAWVGTRADLTSLLKQGARSSSGRLRPWFRNGQAAVQLALATVLVIEAGLLTRSLLRLQAVPLGFDPSSTLTFRIALPPAKYPGHAKGWDFYRELLESLAHLPGVRGVAISSGLPFGAGAYTRTPVSTPSRSVLPAGTAIPIDWRVVSPGFFSTLAIPLLRGRDFSEQDSADAMPVMVVSRDMARRFWGADDPIGKVVHLVNARGRQNADYTVVGVVGDVRNASLNEALPAMYYASSYRLWPSMEVAIRTKGSPEAILPAVRQRVKALDADLPIAAVQTTEQAISASASQPRFQAALLLAFAAVALVIAAIGTYGVVAYSASHWTHEIGVRLALGASPGGVLRLIVGEAMLVGLAGVAAGVAAALAASDVVASLLFGVEARDPFTFVAAAVALLVVVLAACSAPAWRASQVDPNVALREE